MKAAEDLPGTDSSATPPGSRLNREIPTAKQPKALRPIGSLAARLGTRTLVVLLVLLFLFLTVWYTTPYILRDYLNKRGDQLPDYHLNINWVEIHPISCSLDIIDLTLTKKNGEIPVPFAKIPVVHVALQWERVIHFDLLSSITVLRPVVNFVNGPTAATSQTVLEPAWVQTVKQMVPLRINHFEVHGGDLHYRDFHANPQIDMEMDHLELTADNLVNATHSEAEMPSTVNMSGHPFLTGDLNVDLAVNVDMKQPTFAEKVRLQHVSAIDLNAFLAKYASVYARSGALDFYTEMKSEHGHFEGYLKPYFANLAFEPVPKDRGTLAAIWSALANGIKDIFTNDQGVIATDIPVKGTYKDPNVDFWSAAFGIIENAWFQALEKGFNKPEITPSPTDKVKAAPTHQAP